MLTLSQSCGREVQKSAWQLLDSISPEGAFPLQQLLQWDFAKSSPCLPVLASVVKKLKAMVPPGELQDLLLEGAFRGHKVDTLFCGPQASTGICESKCVQ